MTHGHSGYPTGATQEAHHSSSSHIESQNTTTHYKCWKPTFGDFIFIVIFCAIIGAFLGLGLSRWIGVYTVINSATRGNTFGQGASKFGHRVLKAMGWGLLVGFIFGIIITIVMAIFCHGKKKKQTVQQYRQYVRTHPT